MTDIHKDLRKRDDEIRRLYKEGMKREDVAKKFNISLGRVSHLLSPNWRAYEIWNREDKWRALGFTERPTVSQIVERMKQDTPPQTQPTEEPTMADRTFLPTKRNVDGKWQMGLKVECSKQLAGCRNREEIFSSKGGTSQVMAYKKFAADGWHLGGGPHADVCPHCWAKMQEMRKATQDAAKPFVAEDNKPKETTMNVQPVQKPSAIMAHTVLPGPAPSAMTITPHLDGADRTVKKLINDKLHEVYPQLDEGYAAGWSDRRVATDLGAKVEWVAYIREEMFGPEKKPVRDYTKEIGLLEEKGREILEINKNVTAMIAKMDEFDKRFNELIATHDRKKDEFLKEWGELKRKMQEEGK